MNDGLRLEPRCAPTMVGRAPARVGLCRLRAEPVDVCTLLTCRLGPGRFVLVETTDAPIMSYNDSYCLSQSYCMTLVHSVANIAEEEASAFQLLKCIVLGHLQRTRFCVLASV